MNLSSTGFLYLFLYLCSVHSTRRNFDGVKSLRRFGLIHRPSQLLIRRKRKERYINVFFLIDFWHLYTQHCTMVRSVHAQTLSNRETPTFSLITTSTLVWEIWFDVSPQRVSQHQRSDYCLSQLTSSSKLSWPIARYLHRIQLNHWAESVSLMFLKRYRLT